MLRDRAVLLSPARVQDKSRDSEQLLPAQHTQQHPDYVAADGTVGICIAEVQHADELREDYAVDEVPAQHPEGEDTFISKGQACSCQAHQQHTSTDHPLQLPLRGLQEGGRDGTAEA